MTRPSKELLMLIFMYILMLASACPWPYQVHAYRLFIFLTVIILSVPLLMMFKAEECIEDVMKKLRIERKDTSKWKKFPIRISISYLPMVILLVLAGMWVLGMIWLFMYFVLYGIGVEVLKRAEKEGLLCTTDTQSE
jgi:hypothetical protein